MLLDFFLPAPCAACGQRGSTFCAACEAALATRPALLLPKRGRVPPVTALGLHRGRLRTAVLALKFRAMRPAGIALGRWLAPKIVPPFDVIAPVPLHPSRLRERGYNQALAIAQGIAREVRAPVLEHALVRSRATSSQSTLASAQRRSNVAGAFGAGAQSAFVRGARVLLVDDVVTTGATVAACADVLYVAGARAVTVACVAVKP